MLFYISSFNNQYYVSFYALAHACCTIIIPHRHRSIAKSYFRRCDGVLLLYDCMYERSFINVREWMTAIEVTFVVT